MEQSYKKETGNFNIEETGRQTGRRRSKSNLRVKSLPLEPPICKIPNGLREQEFKKPQKSGKKANEKQRKRKETPEIFVERVQKDEKRTRIDDPNVQPKVPYVLFFRSLVPRLVQRCQGNCSINLKPSDDEDYLVVNVVANVISII